jgi:Mg2+ and Co2+ transporter CorA
MELLWLAAGRVERREVSEVAALLAQPEGFLWLDVPAWNADTERVLAETLCFHPLALRDCRARSHIPKLHAYPDHLFLILHAPEPGPAGQIHLLELDYFVAQRFLVTVHGPLNPEVPPENALRETRAVARRLLEGRFVPGSAAELSHAIVSGIAAHMETFVADLTHKVAVLERQVLDRTSGDFQEALEEMFRVRHELLTLRTMASACREVYARMAALSRFLPADSQPFIEDLVDHFERVRSVCDSEREFLQGVVDFYQSRTHVKMNIAMERLALMSAVLLPLTLLASIYGMNIIVNQETKTFELGVVLISMVVVAVAMLGWTRRQGWW